MKLTTMHKLSIIIVSYNVKHYVAQCLNSLEKALDGIDAEVLVVDNHSVDGTIKYIAPVYPWVEIIGNNHNRGYSAANNFGIRQSDSEYVLLLNPDTFVGENTLKEALAFMDSHPACGSLGVRMLKCNGESARESRRGIPTPMTSFYKMIGLCDRFVNNRKFGKYYMGYLPWDEANKIEVVSGAFCMLRRSALEEVGLLDEDYFMYGEDIDLSYRLLQKGYENWYLPSKILHYKGASTSKSSLRYVHVFYKAMLIFYKKHFGGTSTIISLPVYLAIYAKAFIALIGNLIRAMRHSLGFFRKRDADKFRYVFIGKSQFFPMFSKFARRHGLDVVSTQDVAWDCKNCTFSTVSPSDVQIVCDTNSFTYGEMLDIIHANKDKGVLLSVYHPNIQVLITAGEVFS